MIGIVFDAGNGHAVCVLISPSDIMRRKMPVWLEVLLNLTGYAGFVALATHGASCRRSGSNDRVSRDER